MGPLVNCGKAVFLFLVLGNYMCDRICVQATATKSPQVAYGQWAAGVLDREFADSTASYLLLDARSGKLLTKHWENEDEPIPLGSLVKPFTALAYAGTHTYRYPVHECGGKAGGCWQLQSHGMLDIVSATSVSCNSYFRFLAEDVSEPQIHSVANLFDLELPDQNFTTTTLIGLGEQWRISPVKMARAYLELFCRKDQPGVRELIAGMGQSVRRGTGAAVGQALGRADALVKTGTASCTHTPHAPGDGFVIAMAPANQPEILLMIRIHGVPGAKAAETAGRMLLRMEQ
jgi:cell division protein FtsI/penicillin-binding protein 2